MKQLSLRFDDKDYNRLKTAKLKTNMSWERFILALIRGTERGFVKDNGIKKI